MTPWPLDIPYIPCWCNECRRLIRFEDGEPLRPAPKNQEGFLCNECWLKAQPALRQLAETYKEGNDE